jgi:hypothetical protein
MAHAEYVRQLQDAWRSSVVTSVTPSAAPPMSAQPDDDDDEEDEPLSPRDQYIARLQNAYRAPIGRADFSEADAIQRAYIRTAGGGPGPAKPGAEADAIAAARKGRKPGTPGVVFGAHNPDNFPTQDAAINDRDQAYQGYLKRLTDGWRT